MRQIQLVVSDDDRGDALSVLDEWDVEYAIVPGAEEGYDVVFFPIPTDAVEHVLDDLYEAGLDTESYTTVTSTELAVGKRIDALQRRWAGTPNSISPRSLESKVRDIDPNTRAFLWLMFLSSVIATAGLLQGSPAVIVGSMVIAPIVGPALASSVGLLRGERRMLLDGLSSQALGLAVAIVGAALLAALLRLFQFVPPGLAVTDLEFVTVRLAPGLLSLAVGLAAGAAAAYSMATKGSISLVGVMIAAALVPAAATVGIGMAWSEPVLAVGALSLLVLNLAAIDLAGWAMLRYLGYGPGVEDVTGEAVEPSGRDDREEKEEKEEKEEEKEEEEDEREAEPTDGGGENPTAPFLPGLGGTTTLAVTALLVALILLSVGFATATQVSYERTVNQAVTDLLADADYDDLAVVEIRYEYRNPVLRLEPETVTVSLTRTTDREYPDLAARLDEQVTRRTGESVTVRVRFVDYQVSE